MLLGDAVMIGTRVHIVKSDNGPWRLSLIRSGNRPNSEKSLVSQKKKGNTRV